MKRHARAFRLIGAMFVYTAAALLAFTTAGTAQLPDYFPLQEGNQWIYRPIEGSGEPLRLEISRTGYFAGQGYVLLSGLPEGAAWLRLSEERTLYRFDPETQLEEIWLHFGAPVGEPFPTKITPCNPSAVIESREAAWKGPIGEFDNALIVRYPSAICAGLDRDVYLPWVGLLERTIMTAAGPRRYQLVYARLGGVTYVSAPELSITLALDRHRYPHQSPPAVMEARLALRNHRLDPFTLEFSTSQRFDFEIRNERGAVVYRWSDGRAFLMVLGTEEIAHGEKHYTVSVPLADTSGAPLPPGKYTARAWLTHTGPNRFEASVGFEIRP